MLAQNDYYPESEAEWQGFVAYRLGKPKKEGDDPRTILFNQGWDAAEKFFNEGSDIDDDD